MILGLVWERFRKSIKLRDNVFPFVLIGEAKTSSYSELRERYGPKNEGTFLRAWAAGQLDFITTNLRLKKPQPALPSPGGAAL